MKDNTISRLEDKIAQLEHKVEKLIEFANGHTHITSTFDSCVPSTMWQYLITEEYAKKADKIHPSKYKYENYNEEEDKVGMFCKKHDRWFTISASEHLKGKGCPYCEKEKNEQS